MNVIIISIIVFLVLAGLSAYLVINEKSKNDRQKTIGYEIYSLSKLVNGTPVPNRLSVYKERLMVLSVDASKDQVKDINGLIVQINNKMDEGMAAELDDVLESIIKNETAQPIKVQPPKKVWKKKFKPNNTK